VDRLQDETRQDHDGLILQTRNKPKEPAAGHCPAAGEKSNDSFMQNEIQQNGAFPFGKESK
jgi:hypothetical protein